jgi:hypothetical protein
VDEDYAEGFGVICFEALYHEFYWGIVLFRSAFIRNMEGKLTILANEKPVMSKTTHWIN